MAKHDANENHTKQIDIKHHLVQDLLKRGGITIGYCTTTDMIADIFARPLTKLQFRKFQTDLCLRIDRHLGRKPNDGMNCNENYNLQSGLHLRWRK